MARQREALETTALLKKVHIEMNKIGSDISSSEDELLTGESLHNNYSPIESADLKNEFKIDREDDRMSLSSLSSNEKIEESKPETVPPPPPPPPNTTSVPPPLPPLPGIYPHYPAIPHYPGELKMFIFSVIFYYYQNDRHYTHYRMQDYLFII